MIDTKFDNYFDMRGENSIELACSIFTDLIKKVEGVLEDKKLDLTHCVNDLQIIATYCHGIRASGHPSSLMMIWKWESMPMKKLSISNYAID